MKLHTQGYLMSAMAFLGAGIGIYERSGFLLVLGLITGVVCFLIASTERRNYRRAVERLKGAAR